MTGTAHETDRPLVVSNHALVRYRQRFDPKATIESLLAVIGETEPAPAWARKLLPDWVGNAEYRVSPDRLMLFVVRPGYDSTRPARLVVTCYPLRELAMQAVVHGKKKLKRNPAGYHRKFG